LHTAVALRSGQVYNTVVKSTRTATVILLIALALGTGVRISANLLKRTVEHDECIYILSATGHQSAYADIVSGEHAPLGEWTPASRWKELLLIDDKFCFQRISRDLARYDIHPPLYFWALHTWSIFFGIHHWTGLSLNLLIFLFTAAVLFQLARSTLSNDINAAAVVLLWALSPYSALVSTYARPYELFVLWTVLAVWQINELAKAPEKPPWRAFGVRRPS